MKTVLTSIITSLITVIIALFVVHAIMGDGKCMFSGEEHEKECTEHVKKACGDKPGDAHEMMMVKLGHIRAEFETTLSDEEKATITAIREKFEDVDHEKMCAEGKEKFMEQHKADIDALLAIAENHKEFLDGVFTKVHAEKKCEKSGHGEVVKEHACPEAAKCKEATEKCKGEKKAPEAEAKCKEATEECKAECENTFKVHFLLMEEHVCDHDDDDDHEGEEGDDD